MYIIHSQTGNLQCSYALFYEFLLEHDIQVCPKGGNITVIYDKLECSIHNPKGLEKKEDEVPFL